MKEMLFCIFFMFFSLAIYSNNVVDIKTENIKYEINKEGNAFFCREVTTSLSFSELYEKTIAYLSDNFVNPGAGVSFNNNKDLFIVNYVFSSVQKKIPLVLDAWSIIKIELKEGKVCLSLILTNYNKKSMLLQELIRISDTRPLNPKGKKYGFTSHKNLIEAFDKTCLKADLILDALEDLYK